MLSRIQAEFLNLRAYSAKPAISRIFEQISHNSLKNRLGGLLMSTHRANIGRHRRPRKTITKRRCIFLFTMHPSKYSRTKWCIFSIYTYYTDFSEPVKLTHMRCKYASTPSKRLGEIAAQAATSGECKLTKFAYNVGGASFVVHPRAGLYPAAIGVNLTTAKE